MDLNNNIIEKKRKCLEIMEERILFCSHNIQPKCIVNNSFSRLKKQISHCHNSFLMLMAGRSGPIKDDRKMSHWPKLRNSATKHFSIAIVSYCTVLENLFEHQDILTVLIIPFILLTHTFWFGSSRYKRQITGHRSQVQDKVQVTVLR